MTNLTALFQLMIKAEAHEGAPSRTMNASTRPPQRPGPREKGVVKRGEAPLRKVVPRGMTRYKRAEAPVAVWRFRC